MSLPISKPIPSYPSHPAGRRLPTASSGLSLVLGLGLGMAAIIAGTVFAGKAVAFASIPFLVGAIVFLSLYRPIVAFSFYMTYTALEGMYKYLSDFSQTVYVIKPILAIVVVAAWFLSSKLQGIRVKPPPLTALLSAWMVWGCVEVFSPTGTGFVGSLITFLTWYLLPISFYFFCYNVIKSYDQATTVMLVLMMISTVVSGFAIVQYGMGREWTLAHLPGYNEITQHNWWVTTDSGKQGGSSWSPASTTSYSGAASTWANLGSVLALSVLMIPSARNGRKIIFAACLLINILGLLVSGVRLWVVLFPLEAIVVFLFYVRSQANKAHSVRLAALFAVVLVIGYAAAQSLSGGLAGQRYAGAAANPVAKFQHDRGSNLTYLIQFIPANPLGVGFQRGAEGGAKTYLNITVNRETEFAAVAADMGLPGFVFLVLCVLALLLLGWQSFKRLRDQSLKITALTLLMLLTGNVLAFFGGPVIQGADYFWALAGILAALPGIEKRQQAQMASSAQSAGQTI